MPTSIYEDSSLLLRDPAALRDRADTDGYLFFKELFPREEILELRRQFLDILSRHGWLDPSHDMMLGVGAPASIATISKEDLTFCGVGVPIEAYREVQRLELFHALAHHPRVLQLFENLFEAPVLPHPRNIARLMLPSPNNTPTPPHQDFIHIQGTRNVWTCWFPVGDCPITMGNLSMIRGSHRMGLLSPKTAEGAGGLEVQLCDEDYDWVQGDFEAGDAVAFTSLTVHRSLPLQLPNRVRMSCDFRFQPAHEDIEQQSLKVHCDVLEWDDVYAGWNNDVLKYYWQRRDLKLSPWDDSIRWQKRKIC